MTEDDFPLFEHPGGCECFPCTKPFGPVVVYVTNDQLNEIKSQPSYKRHAQFVTQLRRTWPSYGGSVGRVVFVVIGNGR